MDYIFSFSAQIHPYRWRVPTQLSVCKGPVRRAGIKGNRFYYLRQFSLIRPINTIILFSFLQNSNNKGLNLYRTKKSFMIFKNSKIAKMLVTSLKKKLMDQNIPPVPVQHKLDFYSKIRSVLS